MRPSKPADRFPLIATNRPLDTEADQAIDALEVAMMNRLPAAECPLSHTFTPGFYVRQITMAAGLLITSKVHKTTHPYVVTKGAALVWIDHVGWQEIRAPHTGITQAGTRRVLYILEECVWTTFHATESTDLEEIEREIIQPHKDHIAGLTQPTLIEALGALPDYQPLAPLKEIES